MTAADGTLCSPIAMPTTQETTLNWVDLSNAELITSELCRAHLLGAPLKPAQCASVTVGSSVARLFLSPNTYCVILVFWFDIFFFFWYQRLFYMKGDEAVLCVNLTRKQLE